jgi:C-terminal processing protease CtpA/Prc
MTLAAGTVDRLKNLVQQSTDTAWIIDLRNYSGGDFESFRACTSLFLPAQTIFFIKKGVIETVNIGSSRPQASRAVFVIDDSTMLYAELFAHVLKANGSRLIGQNSRGFVPGFKQFFLEDGSSVLLKVGRFEFSMGESLSSTVKPDVICDTADFGELMEICQNTLEGE